AKRRQSSDKVLNIYDESELFSFSSSDISTPQDEVPNEPEVVHDPTLTSLAQLGCFLLDCERSFVSILDNKAQYVIAEATRRVSLNDPVHSGADSAPPTGTPSLDLVWDAGLYALKAFNASDDTRNVSNEHVTLSQDVHIMYDMSLVEGLKGRPYVCGWPHMRFYAAVPIRSQIGIIGIYCVVDKKKKPGLDQEGLESLDRVSSTIVQHLELLKKQYDLRRARGMVRGLGLFVEGKSGCSDQESADQPHPNEKAPTRPPSQDVPGSHGGPVPKATTAPTPSGTVTSNLFSRASSLIRQAIGLDGAMFMDGYSPEPSPSKSAKMSPNGDQKERHLSPSDLLGYSIREHLNVVCTKAAPRQSTLPRTTLQALLRDYWQGLIFFFDEDGFLLGISRPGEDLVDNTTETFKEFQNETKRAWVREILNICPGARTIVFFPLWDPQRDRWSIGGLAWLNTPSGTLQVDEITYLTAFGRCVMNEKSRLAAITAGRTKANFISSVSHELRSPLHGVLASAEALQDTSTNYTQDDLIRTITVCGEVLLDTMDQILDYAKTSKSSDSILSRTTNRSRDSVETLAGEVSGFNLGILVETVVEGIFAGHSFRRSTDSITIAASLANIMIIISIEWRESWTFESHVGGWKRIVMNLFGNALKYTKSGFVHVSLRVDHDPTPESSTREIITLQIEDSGKGISQSYLKHRMFCPFAQEDPMSVGTGLGLSIVRQLVKELGGNIGIQSEEGCGTTVRVTAPVEPCDKTAETLFPDSSSMLSDIRSRCQGLSLCLVGFEEQQINKDETSNESLTPNTKRVSALRSSLISYASDWLGMNITEASSLKKGEGDVVIGLQSRFNLNASWTKSPPLLIFEDDPLNAHFRHVQGITVLTQPVGPQKLARVLGKCLQHKDSVEDFSAFQKLSRPRTLPAEAILPQDLPEDTSKMPDNELNLFTKRSILTRTRQGAHPTELNSSLIHPPISNSDEITQFSEVTMPRRSRVLLVEDCITNLTILSRYMNKQKEEYITAGDGLEAFEKYQTAPKSFKVIFMDIAMPVMDGLLSSRKIRDFELEHSFPRTRIVAMTCFSSVETQAEAFSSGMDMFLIKPVPMKALKPVLGMDPDDFPAG
ncbi:hypothetical protein OIDMADRAFT_133008, partial [Oidiodendron maius Zn]